MVPRPRIGCAKAIMSASGIPANDPRRRRGIAWSCRSGVVRSSRVSSRIITVATFEARSAWRNPGRPGKELLHAGQIPIDILHLARGGIGPLGGSAVGKPDDQDMIP